MQRSQPKMLLIADQRSKRPAARPVSATVAAVVPAKRSKTKAKPGKKVEQPQLTYRPRMSQDDAYILELTRQQLGEVHAQAFGEAFPDEQFLHYIQSGAPTYMILHKGKTIGYYSYLVGPDAKMHISALVIDPKHQSQGIGKAVMKQLEEQAVLQGVRTMEVFVQESNSTSVAFTKSLGFQEVYRFPPHTIGFQKQVGN